MRRHFITVLFVLVGLINLYPVTGVLGAGRLEALYGLPVAGEELLLLLRSRAVLFGLLGAFLLIAAWRPPWRMPAAIAGFVSMLSFLWLALPLEAIGHALQRVFWADVIGSVLLLVAVLAAPRAEARHAG